LRAVNWRTALACTAALAATAGPAGRAYAADTATITRFRFRTSLRAADLVQVVTHGHRLVRNERIGLLRGHTTHTWVWNGRDGRGHRVRPGTYRIRVVARHFDQKAKSHWLRVVVKRRHRR
jgi:flagellar hook assembly protein FlgD